MILAILQARVSSTRLPGKVLKPILGIPMLQHQLDRIKRTKQIDKLIVATSTDKADDGIIDLCKNSGIETYRGSLADVLDRFYQAAKQYKPEHVVRLTGDCPLTDNRIIDDLISFYLENNYDYASNALEPTFPDGLDAEIFKFSALEQAWKNATLPSEREHVTPYIHKSPDTFRIGILKNKTDLSHLRWTVDEPADFVLISSIYEKLYPQNHDFNTSDILNLLEIFPAMKTVNTMHKRNEGLEKSIKADKAGKSHE